VSPSSRPDELLFRPRVLDCFPDPDTHLGCPLPEHVPQFVFPDAVRLSGGGGGGGGGGSDIGGGETPAPTLFHFVLTNVSGVRMYGVALRVVEDVNPTELRWAVRAGLGEAAAGGRQARGNNSDGGGNGFASASGGSGGATAAGAALAEAGAEYAPKALVLLSHYPFYSVYATFLQQLYRISLSDAPLPIERYIANFVCEVPLPPQGQIEVIYALPDRAVSIKRPPKNRLPLADFSYRPLFACLGVENVLTLFGLLLTETKVALLSARYALLNPVAEALLSLLFPLVWQGAYIPVMPLAMADVLDAPVPFLLGLHSSYLREVPAERRPAGVVFVDLDADVVHLGTDENGRPRQRPHMPERETSKLRQKLQGHAAMAYQRRRPGDAANGGGGSGYVSSNSHHGVVGAGGGAGGGSGYGSSGPGGGGGNIANGGTATANASSSANGGGSSSGGGGVLLNPAWALDRVDLAFPNSEHLLPISRFATEQGLTVSRLASSGKA
ncbi:unnamed protein product, partial [Phaeothamnion confervicola]